MKVSKIIGIVVALHVLVIGGIFFFEGCSRAHKSTPEMASNETTPGETTPAATTPDQTPPTAPVAMTPAQPVAPAPVAATATRTHVVKKGDTLTKIAKAEGVSQTELSKANKLTKTSVLKIGQKLTIPGKVEATAVASAAPAAMAPATTAAAAPAAVQGATYAVKSGDSLWKIAKANNSTVAAIKQANSLSGDALKVGQKLTIPATAQAAATTTPAAPVTAAATAAPAAITTVSAKAAPASTEFMQPGKYVDNNQTIHIVDFNESPALIAKKYGVKTDDLMKANNITDPRKVHYGQRLVIPSTAPATTASLETPLGSPIVAATPATVR
jgi:LysM repeat protein